MTKTSVPNDWVPPKLDFASDEAKARIKRRYRAEKKFRLAGIMAVVFAGLCILTLMADVIRKAVPSFTYSSAVLDIDLPQNQFDPNGLRNPDDLRKQDYAAPINKALEAEFPTLTDRRAKRALGNVLSSGADTQLRKRVLTQPDLIGKTTQTPVLLSDEVDLALKGLVSKTQVIPGTTAISLLAEGKKFRFESSAPVLAAHVSAHRERVQQRLSVLEKQQTNLHEQLHLQRLKKQELESAIQSRERMGSSSTTLQAELAQIDSNISSLTKNIDNLSSQMDERRQQLAATDKPALLDEQDPSLILKIAGGFIRLRALQANAAEGEAIIPPSRDVTSQETNWSLLVIETPEANRKLQDITFVLAESLRDKGKIVTNWNLPFLSSGDSREAELAGIMGGLVGSALTMLVTLALCLPIGVAAAIYLEEFAPKNRLTEIIEININNLAAVPSIVFGLLGLAMFLNVFGLPRSAPLVGGLVLALLILPTIIIAARAALKAVPPSIREAALGVGATKQQAIFHHVLPLAMPGIMTGTIIGMAHALGETAPLLMIGMVAFIVDVPKSITDAATVLPVQIFLWSDLPEPAFQAKTAGAILVLLVFLIFMNSLAVVLRKRFERRW